MEMGVGGLVHVVLCPLLEALRLDGLAAISRQLFPVEIVTGIHLQKAVFLLAHLYNLNNQIIKKLF
jgi:hypothetical protein